MLLFFLGTTVTVTNLFKNIPVRRQFYEGSRKAAEELKRIEKVVKHLSIIHPKLRVTLAHNKCLIWHKTSVYSLRQSLMQVFPNAILKNLKDVCCSFENASSFSSIRLIHGLQHLLILFSF